ncbi:hypothetical protein BES34_007915 [Leptospira inadai serovar Lyme]|uniref:Uncharacterized protein n=1 Tax=Leptospira inadai serovar Lyme TaxID=293084 RepID=A0ABX4YJU3_9LEPT|nr:hypothetical protein BES34_007915 [Leptospira inadai serovar Lyme]
MRGGIRKHDALYLNRPGIQARSPRTGIFFPNFFRSETYPAKVFLKLHKSNDEADELPIDRRFRMK